MKKGHVSRADALVELQKAITRACARRAEAGVPTGTGEYQYERVGRGTYVPTGPSPEVYGPDEGSDIGEDL